MMRSEPQFGSSYRSSALFLLLLLGLVLAFLMLLPFVPALLWAVVLAVLTAPWYRKLRDRFAKTNWLKGDRAPTVAALGTTFAALAIICIPFVVVAAGLYVQWQGISQDVHVDTSSITAVLASADESLKPLYESVGHPEFSLVQAYQENREDIAAAIQEPAKQLARKVGFTLFTIVVALLTMFFMLRDGGRLRDPALELMPIPRERGEDILRRVAETIHAVFVGTVLVAMIQGLIIGVAYALAGVPSALLLGVLSAILCIVPLLGAPVIYIPVGISLILQGNYTGAAIVLGVGFVIVSNVDNFLKPWLIGGRVSLHPIAIFFSILGGVFFLGPVGVMAGPMLLTVLLALVEVVQERLRADPLVSSA